MCERLYDLCVERLCPLLENAGAALDWSDALECGPLDNLAGRLADDLLEGAARNATKWNDSWIIFLTPKITSAVLKWDRPLIEFVGRKCKNLRRVLFRWGASASASAGFDPTWLKALPRSVASVDFDGELHRRAAADWASSPALKRRLQSSWLPDAEAVLKALSSSVRQGKQPPVSSGRWLSELHLGTVAATPDQLMGALEAAPGLRLLRHYHLVAALYARHAAEWRGTGVAVAAYQLTNLDADFSHVVRRRMSPEAVLAGDALRLAAALCPDAVSVRVRVDCATPHDVLAPLADLRRLRELSVVCVTSGERSNLDFSDIVPILEAHGGTSLTTLELKVMEEVDAHQVVSLCPLLESLVLSGCGFASPDCNPAAAGCGPRRLRRLRLLFYADGDDFSWTHTVPQCFWRATLSPGAGSRLTGIFLDSPRISEATASQIWPPLSERPPPLYAQLAALSLFRCPEITIDQVCAAARGAEGLRYLRASHCDRLHPKRLRQAFAAAGTRLVVHTDRPTDRLIAVECRR